MKQLILFGSLVAQAAFASAQAPAPQCGVAHPVILAGDKLSWSGACREGLADGPGVLLWHRAGAPAVEYEVTLVRGEISGVGTMASASGFVYQGRFKDAVPHGRGTLHYTNGDTYEGDVADGLRHGQGTWTGNTGSRYEGQWKAGQIEGTGRVTFALGGSYEGEWKKNRFDGKGVLTYAGSGRRVEGEFSNGRLVGTPEPVALTDQRYSMKDRGLFMPPELANAPYPPDKSWEELTPAQQQVIRAAYPALAPGDEPPYPRNGSQPIFTALAKAVGRLEADVELTLHVQVGADGKARSVKAFGSPPPYLRHAAARAMLATAYKPAVCDGTPCEMIYPISFLFTKD